MSEDFHLELSLVVIIDKKTGRKTYYGVNEKHYDGMLAMGGCWEIEKDYDWNWLGDVRISQEILNEQGFFYKDD